MRGLQVAAVAMCILLTALDGFDVLSISFAAPGIAAEWGIDRAALGIVLSMELIGMAVGSILIGGLADRFGRRPAIFGCLALMTTGMYLASTAVGLTALSIYRLGTGLGIGGMLASTNAMAAEFSNLKRRNLSVILMAAGYPAGAIVGGTIASLLLVSFDWRAVFLFGAFATLSFIPLTWLLLPESIEYLLLHRPKGALERINKTLRRMSHNVIDTLPEVRVSPRASNLKSLFSPALIRTTLLLTVAYFTHIVTFYFTLKWIPKIVVDMGFAPSLAGGVLVWANVGGLTGSILLGLLALRYNVKPLVIGALVFAAGMVTWFGQGQADLVQLSIVAAAAGFFTNAGVVGLYALFAQSFPTEVRAGGTGFVIGVGRGGSVAGPIAAGFLFTAGAGLPTVALLMGLGSLIAAVMLVLLKPAASQR
jgi:MFS transporter, AAHS family, vanillate permease